ncbi:MAG: hypothetical protein BWK76_24695 [Desulfobulbaceae bacterium A2]|nr:MAG: hypothetical protein BWK76_24695 [Desulfobulbaceae bacterium A2]
MSLARVRYFFLSTLGLLLLAEGLYFFLLPRACTPEGKIDLLVVFQGSPQRTRNAYQLMQRLKIDNFITPGATQSVLQSYALRYSVPDTVRILPASQRTHSTFEDALLAGQAIRHNKVNRVLLITSDYHLPRSLLLLRLQTIGSGAEILGLGVSSDGDPIPRYKRNINEMIKTWGSLLQLCYYRCTGRPVSSASKFGRIVDQLERHLLL